MDQSKESKFQKWFYENPPQRFYNVDKEVCLFSAYSLLGNDLNNPFSEKIQHSPIGRIDLTFTYGSKMYVCEIKYKDEQSFWEALKVKGYCSYYNWQREVKDKIYHPAIMIPGEHYKLEHFVVARQLKIDLFGIEKTKNDYKVERIDNDLEYMRKHSKKKSRPGKIKPSKAFKGPLE